MCDMTLLKVPGLGMRGSQGLRSQPDVVAPASRVAGKDPESQARFRWKVSHREANARCVCRAEEAVNSEELHAQFNHFRD